VNKVIAYSILTVAFIGLFSFQDAYAALITDPDDPRIFLGATVGTFAQHFFGSDTLVNRQMVVDQQLLDDGLFDITGTTPATLVANAWTAGGGGASPFPGVAGGHHPAGNARGTSSDLTGVGGFGFAITNGLTVFQAGNTIDNTWFQSSNTLGDTVFDLGGPFTKAAIFNTIDHGPLPQEAIESTVFLSNSPAGPWTQAVVERVWLEGYQPILGIEWDGFVFAVGTGTEQQFQFVSIIHGGPGALVNDGDDEINGVLGVQSSFKQECPPGFTGTFPECIPITTSVVGGELLPIETTSLLVAGAQSTTWMIPLVLSAAGVGLVLVRSFRFNLSRKGKK